MFIFIFYSFWITYTVILGYCSTLLFEGFSHPMLYVLFFLSIMIGFVLSFISILAITGILGEFRKGKDTLDPFNHQFARSLLVLANHLLRVKVVVTGRENIPEGKFIFFANHQENEDIVILKPIFKNHPINFIAKESLVNMPIIGKWIVLLGNIPISKFADRSAAESIVKAIKEFNHGNPIGIFPEGKRSFSNEMNEFKPGAFKLAMKPKADILVGTIYNFINLYKGYPFKRQTIYVHIHPLLKYDDYKDLTSHELSDKVREIIQSKLDEFKEKIK
ncbi:MAG: 1-acyl-sn-glycerol-3-phosphate acyltransferase [Bacilli bacterium]|nr:1-acyl-sn-glycerol-3-phosphate acyltransferase [Bacilli bacterium]